MPHKFMYDGITGTTGLAVVIVLIVLVAPSIADNNAYAILINELELEGHMASLQQIDDEVTYLLHGHFETEVEEEEEEDTTAEVESEVTMVRTDGTNYHKMIFEDLKVDVLEEDRIEGKIDVYGEHGDEPRFLVANDASVIVRIYEDTVFTIEIDKNAVHGYFGSDPIYGEIYDIRMPASNGDAE
jgi:hypothetical protein